jgi:putative transposase
MINISQYMLLEFLAGADGPLSEEASDYLRVERVLNFNPDAGEIILINIYDPEAWPVLRHLADIQVQHKSGLLIEVKNDPFLSLMRPEQDIKKKNRESRDRAWDEVAGLLHNETVELMLDARIRGQIIRAHCEQTITVSKHGKAAKLSGTTARKRLRLYWQSGRRKNAFLPDFNKCGAAGKPRIAESTEVTEEHPKVGRRSALARISNKLATGIGIRMTAEVYRKFEVGTNKFYVGEKRSLTNTYDLIINKYFHIDYEVVKGIAVPVLPEVDKLPSFDQYKYWYHNIRDNINDSRARKGEREYNTKSRPITGVSSHMSFGPGYLYQIDSTIANIYLVSSLDRTRIIGRPVLYSTVDVYSVALAGFCVTLEGPSWLSGIMALDNAFSNKMELCAEYGLGIEEREWPICGLPKGLLADRGEFEGYDADRLVGAFGMHVHNTGPFRPDWKGYVERHFGIADERTAKFTPGYVPPMGQARGDPDYDLKAALTLDEFRMLMILHALDYNMNYYLKRYHKGEFMISDRVQRYPLEIWNYGIKRTGLLGDLPRDVVRLNLLPRARGSITPAGIHFPQTNLYYDSDYILERGWLTQARDKGNIPIEFIHDPRTTKFIYIPVDGGQKLLVCGLTPACRNLPDHDWHDARDYYALEAAAAQAAETRRLRSGARLQAAKEHVVSGAVEKTRAAHASVGHLSKRSRRSGRRRNRAEEKQLEREQSAWVIGDAGAEGIQNGKESFADSSSLSSDNAGYVPPTSHIDLIEELLEKG